MPCCVPALSDGRDPLPVSEERPSAEGAEAPSPEAQELRRRLEEAERTVLEQRLLIEATNGRFGEGRERGDWRRLGDCWSSAC